MLIFPMNVQVPHSFIQARIQQNIEMLISDQKNM